MRELCDDMFCLIMSCFAVSIIYISLDRLHLSHNTALRESVDTCIRQHKNKAYSQMAISLTDTQIKFSVLNLGLLKRLINTLTFSV